MILEFTLANWNLKIHLSSCNFLSYFYYTCRTYVLQLALFSVGSFRLPALSHGQFLARYSRKSSSLASFCPWEASGSLTRTKQPAEMGGATQIEQARFVYFVHHLACRLDDVHSPNTDFRASTNRCSAHRIHIKKRAAVRQPARGKNYEKGLSFNGDKFLILNHWFCFLLWNTDL